MSIGFTTAAGIISGALRRCQAFQAGEALPAVDANDGLDVLNDLLDMLSIDKQCVFGSNEWLLSWTAQKNIYTVGNPSNAVLSGANNTGAVGAATSPTLTQTWPNITGTLTSGSPTISSVTSIPSNLVAGAVGTSAYQVGSGSILTDVQGFIAAGTTCIGFNAGAQTITMSANATGSSSGTDSIAYTVPGDFPIPRPLRITHGFTRFNTLDFTLDVYETQSQFTEILYKAQPGPWPTVAWYNNQFPYGLLNVYQTPGNNAALHLFADTQLSNLTLNQVVSMPQGYNMCLKNLLARYLWVEYVSPVNVPIMLEKLASEALAQIKAINAKPAPVARYDRALARGNRPDAGFILHGGYR